jgi:hypothetical protein
MLVSPHYRGHEPNKLYIVVPTHDRVEAFRGSEQVEVSQPAMDIHRQYLRTMPVFSIKHLPGILRPPY